MLSRAGYQDILPPLENCIPITNHYTVGLPAPRKGRSFSARLDQLLPLLFASHPLVGTNHNAEPDIAMLRLMVLLLIELQKSPRRRDLTGFPQSTQDFVTSGPIPSGFLDEWLQGPTTRNTDGVVASQGNNSDGGDKAIDDDDSVEDEKGDIFDEEQIDGMYWDLEDEELELGNHVVETDQYEYSSEGSEDYDD